MSDDLGGVSFQVEKDRRAEAAALAFPEPTYDGIPMGTVSPFRKAASERPAEDPIGS